MKRKDLQMEKYSCICGFATDSCPSCLGHKRHCKQHLISIGKYEEIKKLDARVSKIGQKASKEKANSERDCKISEWISEKHQCKTCGKIMTEKFGSGIYCCRSCANKRTHSEETKEKIRQSVINLDKSEMRKITTGRNKSMTRKNHKEEYYKHPKLCKYCNNAIPYELRDNKTCGNAECIQALKDKGARKGGTTSAAKIVKRSKNEIAFCELCEGHFGIDNVLHNVVMFNGWDADIILLKEKIAILWNGP
jgi:ribosomal protein L37AE/L43A